MGTDVLSANLFFFLLLGVSFSDPPLTLIFFESVPLLGCGAASNAQGGPMA